MAIRIVGVSGGIDSQAAALWVRKNFPSDPIYLVNSDAGGNEHPLTTAFLDDHRTGGETTSAGHVRPVVFYLGRCAMQDRNQWLEARRGGIGATDIASIVGAGFGDPRKVYSDKVIPLDLNKGIPPVHPLLRLGLATQEINAELFEESMGEHLVPYSNEITWGNPVGRGVPVFASLDFATAETRRPVDTKYVVFFGDNWGEPLTADVPTGYFIQLQWQMYCYGNRDYAYNSVLSGNGEHRIYQLTYDHEMIRSLFDVAEEFWGRFVVPKVEPPADWTPGAAESVLARCEYVSPGSVITLSDNVIALAEQYKELKKIEAESKAEADCRYQAILEAMGAAERAVGNGWKFKRSVVAAGRVEYDREAYTRLTITPPKGMKL